MTKDKSAFDAMFQLSAETDSVKSDSSMTVPQEGENDDNPIRLQGDTANEFRALLWALYALLVNAFLLQFLSLNFIIYIGHMSSWLSPPRTRTALSLSTSHGLPTNSIMVHAYPCMERMAEIRDAHDAPVLFSALAPGGEMIATAAADEKLKFWRIWEAPPKKKTEKGKGTTSGSILTLR